MLEVSVWGPGGGAGWKGEREERGGGGSGGRKGKEEGEGGKMGGGGRRVNEYHFQ